MAAGDNEQRDELIQRVDELLDDSPKGRTVKDRLRELAEADYSARN